MIQISYITKKALDEIKEALGERAIKYESSVHNDEYIIGLNKNVILKCYGFDKSIQLDLGGRLYSLSKEDYWKIEIS